MGAPDGCRDQVGDDAALLADVYAGRAIRGMLFDVEGPVLLEMERETWGIVEYVG